MARGRKKDLTIPPSRSLDHQRAYRDRKARYVADLEERCQKYEVENQALRSELLSMKAEREGETGEREGDRMVRHLGIRFWSNERRV